MSPKTEITDRRRRNSTTAGRAGCRQTETPARGKPPTHPASPLRVSDAISEYLPAGPPDVTAAAAAACCPRMAATPHRGGRPRPGGAGAPAGSEWPGRGTVPARAARTPRSLLRPPIPRRAPARRRGPRSLREGRRGPRVRPGTAWPDPLPRLPGGGFGPRAWPQPAGPASTPAPGRSLTARSAWPGASCSVSSVLEKGLRRRLRPPAALRQELRRSPGWRSAGRSAWNHLRGGGGDDLHACGRRAARVHASPCLHRFWLLWN